MSESIPSGLYCFDEIYQRWKIIFDRHMLKRDTIVRTIQVKDDLAPRNRPPTLYWMKRREIMRFHKAAQAYQNDHPGAFTLKPESFTEPGLLTTLKGIVEFKDQPELLCAWLISASLQSRIASRRSIYPEKYWPPFLQALRLHEFARKQLERTGITWWTPGCVESLPVQKKYQSKLSSFDDLIRFLAAEHAELLRVYAPVLIEHVSPAHAKAGDNKRARRRKVPVMRGALLACESA